MGYEINTDSVDVVWFAAKSPKYERGKYKKCLISMFKAADFSVDEERVDQMMYVLSKMRNTNLKGDDFMKSSDQMAIEWEMSKRTINDLCNKGK